MDNKKPMSPIGQALFDMMNDMNRSQARIYAEGPLTESRLEEARVAANMTATAHQPLVLQHIKRISR